MYELLMYFMFWDRVLAIAPKTVLAVEAAYVICWEPTDSAGKMGA